MVNYILVFCRKYITFINLIFLAILALSVPLFVQKEKKTLFRISGRIEYFENTVVRHSRQCVFKLKNYKASFQKIKIIDSPTSFDWFEWLDLNIGDEVEFYIDHDACPFLEKEHDVVDAIGFKVRGAEKESVAASIINRYYRQYFGLIILPFSLINICFFCLVLFPGLRYLIRGHKTWVIRSNWRIIIFFAVIIFLLSGIPWLLSREQKEIEGSVIYRSIVTYWKFFLLLLMMTLNFVVINKLRKSRTPTAISHS